VRKIGEERGRDRKRTEKTEGNRREEERGR